MAIAWKDGDTITADKLNGSQVTFSSTDVETGATTTQPDGALTLDVNGDLYQADAGKQDLLVSLKGLKGDKGDTGVAGPAGAVGPAGKDGLGVKSGTINEDKNGAVTGATLTMSDNSTVDLTLNKATS
ncbi:hypothetical protein FD12_GL001395 [Lentilactobacillus rapi DSM 19907 = JCM 15042]|uniref:Collagen-like protein n=2 Tax=Lentilactobacillus rapi TaxID=481723 RepID=A0A512PLE1_9LACO|nr:collagen-like protein [Lentilactobacillus rapi]KRL17866.1 hypothetical protein FD12_GL001395 [Lentilactobacillus rapi DSM 19907 = JCM 15042]GEP72029.1 hypothetical protein LRA02_08970 [Lentilactobacillus rapi]